MTDLNNTLLAEHISDFHPDISARISAFQSAALPPGAEWNGNHSFSLADWLRDLESAARVLESRGQMFGPPLGVDDIPEGFRESFAAWFRHAFGYDIGQKDMAPTEDLVAAGIVGIYKAPTPCH